MACLSKGKENQHHFVLIPLLAQGHIIPMVDLAFLLAERGVHISLITSPVNAARIKPVMNRAAESNLPIEFVEIKIPCDQIGLPDGAENVDLLLLDPDKFLAFFGSMHLIQDPIVLYARSHRLPPSCIIADACNPWTVEIARRLEIPRVVFHGPSSFFVLCDYNTVEHRVFDRVIDLFEPFVVPDMPITVRVNKVNGPGFFNWPGWEKIREDTIAAERTADGIILNTFEDLERPFIEQYEKGMGTNVWTVGPLCLYNKDLDSMCYRGNKAGVDNRHLVLSWLDSMQPKSVIYANFGSLARKGPSQLIELGFGLEATNKPFILVLKEVEIVPEVETWLEAFRERVTERGIIVRGWAPQLAILSHPATGGFMTHCGWNSILESISMGVPMVTWPHFADQFINEKLVVDVLGLGVSIGVEMPMTIVPNDVVLIKRDDVAKAIATLTDEGEEAAKRRKLAKEMGEKARKAMQNGGSSYENITSLINKFHAPSKDGIQGKDLQTVCKRRMEF